MDTEKLAELRFKKYEATQCRICKSTNLYNFLSLDSMPIPNGFLFKEELEKHEPRYPLGANVCKSCWMVQLTHTVPPELMFKNYVYIPSTSSTMLSHFKSMALQLVEKLNLKSSDLVMDIGSNEGTLLGFFKEMGTHVLGVDPASNLAEVARRRGINTIDTFFTAALAKEIADEGINPKVITATNVVAHMNDLDDLCLGIRALLHKEGIFSMEFPYLLDLIEKNEFDTIYHEHLSYLSIHPLVQLFDRYQLQIVDVQRFAIHGGSIRVFVAKKESQHRQSRAVQECLAAEIENGLNKKETYDRFAERVKEIKTVLMSKLKELRAQGKKIIGYGASAKGNVLLNYCEVTTDLVEYMVDSISHKQGKLTPGTHIPIYPESKMADDRPDYALLLAWNFKDEILKKQADFRAKGGKFIVPIPQVHIE